MDPHLLDRTLLLMRVSDVPPSAMEFMREEKEGVFAVFENVVIFAPGGVYGILPLWVADDSSCAGEF